MTERGGQTQKIRIPRIAVAQPSGHLTGLYSPPSSTLPRRNDILNTPTYIADHLPTRRLSEVDSPLYLPSLLSLTTTRRDGVSGYATTPLRIRTDVTSNPKFVETETDVQPVIDRFTNYPATSAVIGLQPPRVPSSIDDEKPTVVAETSEDVDRLALFDNSSLGYQRVCFLLSRYPAVALTIISTWMMWGRGLGLTSKSSNENVCYIVSFTAGVFILSSQVLLSASYGYTYKKAKILAGLYHFSNTIAILISITVIVFASISFQNVKATNYLTDSCTWRDPNLGSIPEFYCVTPSERTIFLSILIGAASLIILIDFVSGVYGLIGLALMKKKRQAQFRRFAEVHDNSTFRF